MLSVKLNCQYGEFTLQMEQQLPSDQIIGLFGASGSGKSRFLRQLIGFDRQNNRSSNITLNNQVWSDSNQSVCLDPNSRGIGYLPQTIDLFPHLNVLDNITFPLTVNNQPTTAALDYLLEELQIDSITKLHPNQLSGGQKQRVALARAIMASRTMLILDEPTSAVGEEHKAIILNIIKRLSAEHRFPIIVASHDRIEHAFLSQYLLTFNNGRIEQSSIYDEIAADITGNFAQKNDAINHITAKVEEFHKDVNLNSLTTSSHQLWAGNIPFDQNSQVELEVKAQDISLCLSKENTTSILNCLEVSIVDYKELSGHQYLIKLNFEKQNLTTFITKKSFVDLKLYRNMSLFAQFKSISVRPLRLSNASSNASPNKTVSAPPDNS